MRVLGYEKEHSNKCFSRKCELTISWSLEVTLLRSLQYVSTQKQKVISSAGSYSTFSLGQHYPLPSGPPIWPRIPGAAVSKERLQSHREVDAQFCHSQNCVTSDGSSPSWAHTASTMNCVTSDGSSPSLGPHCLHWELENTEVLQEFWLEILKPSAVPYGKLLWSGVFWDSKSCNFQKMNIRHFRKIWNTTDLLS